MSPNKKALIIIDVQKDFFRGGAAAVEGAESIVPMVKRYLEGFVKSGGLVYAVRELHPANNAHVKDSGDKRPPHCLTGTAGAEFHEDLKLPEETIIITRGQDHTAEFYSAFEGTDEEGRTLQESLIAKGVNHIYLAGIATEYAVKATALEGKEDGFFVTILIDVVKAINKKRGDYEFAIDDMRKAGAETRDYNCLILQLNRSMQKIQR